MLLNEIINLEIINNTSTVGNLNPVIWQHNNKIYLTTCTNSNNQMLKDTTSNLFNQLVKGHLTGKGCKKCSQESQTGTLASVSNYNPT